MFCSLMKSNKGSTSVIIICITIIIVLISAFVVDVGYVTYERYKLVYNAKLTARAGAEILAENKDNDADFIRNYAVKKVGDLNNLEIKISSDKRELSVYMERPFEYIFLRLIGFKGKQLKASVTARLSNVATVKGLRPMAVEKQDFPYERPCELSDADVPGTIKFVPLDFGSNEYRTSIMYGYRKKVFVGENLFALQGDVSEVTNDCVRLLAERLGEDQESAEGVYSRKGSRIIILPVVDRIDSTGNDEVKVIGFTAFYIDSCSMKDGHNFIDGKFIKYIVDSETSDGAADFGLSGVKLYYE